MTKTYTVYSPAPDDRPEKERLSDYLFLKEGYSLWAAIFGPFWSLANGMWLEAAGHIGLIIVVSIIMDLIGFNPEAISGAYWIGNLIFGFFARDLQCYHYERDGFEMVSVVHGKSFAECELTYFRNRKSESLNNADAEQTAVTKDPSWTQQQEAPGL